MEWFTQCEEGGYNGLHGDGLLDLQGKTDWCLWSVGQGNRSVPDAQCGSSTQKDVIHFPFLWCWNGEGVGRWYGLVVMLVMGVGRWGASVLYSSFHESTIEKYSIKNPILLANKYATEAYLQVLLICCLPHNHESCLEQMNLASR